jgi:hypothetical protein
MPSSGSREKFSAHRILVPSMSSGLDRSMRRFPSLSSAVFPVKVLFSTPFAQINSTEIFPVRFPIMLCLISRLRSQIFIPVKSNVIPHEFLLIK